MDGRPFAWVLPTTPHLLCAPGVNECFDTQWLVYEPQISIATTHISNSCYIPVCQILVVLIKHVLEDLEVHTNVTLCINYTGFIL